VHEGKQSLEISVRQFQQVAAGIADRFLALPEGSGSQNQIEEPEVVEAEFMEVEP
jgi:hypothetical protein